MLYILFFFTQQNTITMKSSYLYNIDDRLKIHQAEIEKICEKNLEVMQKNENSADLPSQIAKQYEYVCCDKDTDHDGISIYCDYGESHN